MCHTRLQVQSGASSIYLPVCLSIYLSIHIYVYIYICCLFVRRHLWQGEAWHASPPLRHPFSAARRQPYGVEPAAKTSLAVIGEHHVIR